MAENVSFSDGEESVLDFVILTVLSRYISMLVDILGCLGNLYGVFLLLKKFQIRKTIACYLAFLAAWDATLCGTHFFVSLPYQEFEESKAQYAFLQLIARFMVPVGSICMTAAVWMIIVITNERHWAVWKPLQHMAHDTIRRARITCLVTSVLAVVFNIRGFFELRVIPPSINETAHRVGPTAFRTNPVYLQMRIILSIVFESLVPLIILLVLSLRMIRSVRRAVQLRHTMAIATRNSDRQMTVMLLALVAKFLLCYSLPMTLNLWEAAIGSENADTSLFFTQMTVISDLLVITNSATNCLVYFKWKSKFKRNGKITNGRSSPMPTKAKIEEYTYQTAVSTSDKNRLTTALIQATPRAPNKNQRLADGVTSRRHSIESISMFSTDEADLIRKIWTEQFEAADPTIGRILLCELLKHHPVYGSFFGLTEAQCTSLTISTVDDHERIVSEADRITHFLKNVAMKMGSKDSEKEAAKKTHSVAQMHFRRNIPFKSSAIWLEFRKCMQGELCKYFGRVALDTPTAERYEEVWRRYVCFIIKEMKHAHNDLETVI